MNTFSQFPQNQPPEQQINVNSKSSTFKINYSKFYLIVSLAIVSIFIFLGWSLFQGSGEQNLGAWLIIFVIPATAVITVICVGISLSLKAVFHKIFGNKLNRPILITVLITIFVTAIFEYITSPNLAIEKLSLELVIDASGIIIIGLFAVLIDIFSKIFKASVPNFWKFNLSPAIITFSSTFIAMSLIITGTNYIFSRMMYCNLVWGQKAQNWCYYVKAVKTGDVNLCREKNLDQLIKGDCIMAIAEYKNDASLCELPEIKSNVNNYNFCLSVSSGNQ